MSLNLIFTGISLERVLASELARVLVKVGDKVFLCWVSNASHLGNVLILEFKRKTWLFGIALAL